MQNPCTDWRDMNNFQQKFLARPRRTCKFFQRIFLYVLKFSMEILHTLSIVKIFLLDDLKIVFQIFKSIFSLQIYSIVFYDNKKKIQLSPVYQSIARKNNRLAAIRIMTVMSTTTHPFIFFDLFGNFSSLLEPSLSQNSNKILYKNNITKLKEVRERVGEVIVCDQQYPEQ